MAPDTTVSVDIEHVRCDIHSVLLRSSEVLTHRCPQPPRLPVDLFRVRCVVGRRHGRNPRPAPVTWPGPAAPRRIMLREGVCATARAPGSPHQAQAGGLHGPGEQAPRPPDPPPERLRGQLGHTDTSGYACSPGAPSPATIPTSAIGIFAGQRAHPPSRPRHPHEISGLVAAS